jgi:hypothetical protein
MSLAADTTCSPSMVESVVNAVETFGGVAASKDEELELLSHASSTLSHVKDHGLRSRLWSVMNRVWADGLLRKGNDAARSDFLCLQYVASYYALFDGCLIPFHSSTMLDEDGMEAWLGTVDSIDDFEFVDGLFLRLEQGSMSSK